MFEFLHFVKMAAVDTAECEIVEHFLFVIIYERDLLLTKTLFKGFLTSIINFCKLFQ